VADERPASFFYSRENTKAVASVEMAVPTMVAGEQSVEISEGETSGDDFSDGDLTDMGE
jgi:hypothetical protein